MLDLFHETWKDLWAESPSPETVGAVFTRPEIVELILDLAGYLPDQQRLAEIRVLEPSCGDGAFVSKVIERLIESELRFGAPAGWNDPALDTALRAADIDSRVLHHARALTIEQLTAAGCSQSRAAELAALWFIETDFLLYDWQSPFDLVVGNPPYVRIEDLPRRVLEQYRSLFSTATDRADLYVAFIEQGLRLLSANGVLAYITANRFAKNLYGRALRTLITRSFHVRYYLNLEHTQPFLSDVSAYPAILVIDRQRGQPTRAATLDRIDPQALECVRREAVAITQSRSVVSEFQDWYPGGAPWISTCADERERLASFARDLVLLEESAPGTKVGIGIATGADRVFILPGFTAEIEWDRQLPLALAKDITNHQLNWSGHVLVDPYDPDGTGELVDLRRFPLLDAYFDQHQKVLKGRHTAQRQPRAWYRTIDRVSPGLRSTPKLLIPDIQNPAATTIGFDEGKYYPHHNLYWVTSKQWDLRALKTILRSSIVIAQVKAHSVQMRGGSIRWQAQTLRKLRIPALDTLTGSVVDDLVRVSTSADQSEIDDAVDRAFSAS
jgi:hypothetical protein